nr:choice-of-anchor D domain-containing protein [Propionibacteriales bacterium]
MVCTPLPVDNGAFLNTNPWESTATKTFDGKTVTLTPGGPNPGLSIQKGASSHFHPLLAQHQILYAVLGNKWLAINDHETGIGLTTRYISVFNFDTMNEVNVITVSATSAQQPVLLPSPAGSMFLAYGQDGTQLTAVGIYRSDNGALLCGLGAPIVATGQTAASATATQLTIHYTTASGSVDHTCPRPTAHSTIAPSFRDFGSVAVGGCPIAPPTRQFTITNSGSDCLTVSAIGNNGPYSVTLLSKPLPAILGPSESMTVTVAFAPTVAGTYNLNLPVTISPAVGDSQLVCRGSAVAASFAISIIPTTVAFGAWPVGQPHPALNITITNTGSRAQTVSSVAGVSADGFTVAPFSAGLGCGQSTTVPVSFTPASEGFHEAFLAITHQAGSGQTQVHLTGTGCVPNAIISAPAQGSISFGDVQQGFRTVKTFVVTNTGDGPLEFHADITGTDAALFGLPDPGGSLASPPSRRGFHVDPTVPCGPIPAGTGQTLVAVSFVAGNPPGATAATATLTLSAHNATNYPAGQTWVYPLSATITPPVALDVGLVVDRSGSMTDPLGSRVKMDAAISASQLFVELLRPDLDDRVSIVRFNNSVDVIQAITPVSSANAPTQTTIRNRIASDIPPATLSTAIAGGATRGVQQVQTPHPGSPSPLTKAVVILTDGIENTAFEDPPGTFISILGGPKYRPDLSGNVNTSVASWPADVKRYAIGLGRTNEIDATQLDALTGDANRVFRVDQDLTGLRYFQLEKYYTAIFMDVVGSQSILDPMNWIAAGDTHEIEFEILPGDVDAIVVIYDFEGARLPFYCLSPKGEVVDPSSVPVGFQFRSGFTSETRLVHFKMPPLEPDRYAGTWKVVIRHAGEVCFGSPNPRAKEPGFQARECQTGITTSLLYGIAIGAGSNFRLQPYVNPGPVWVGEPILLTGVVSEAGLPVTGAAVIVDVVDPLGQSVQV